MDRWVSTKIQWLCDIEYSEGHSTKNDLSMEVLRDFCTRETFLWSVPSNADWISDLPTYLLSLNLYVNAGGPPPKWFGTIWRTFRGICIHADACSITLSHCHHSKPGSLSCVNSNFTMLAPGIMCFSFESAKARGNITIWRLLTWINFYLSKMHRLE
jgi:hypothetical protein